MIKDQATPATADVNRQGMDTKTIPESGQRNSENVDKTHETEKRKPRRSSRSPVVKKNPEDDENLDPVTKIMLAKKITEFSAEQGRDPSKDEIEQMFEDTNRVLAGELVDESFVCDHTSEPQEDAEDIAETALPIELTDAPADGEEIAETPIEPTDVPVKTAISELSQPATESNAEEKPDAMSAKPGSLETGQAKSAQEIEEEKNPQEIDSKVAQPEATEGDSGDKVAVPTETEKQTSPNEEELPPYQEEMADDDAAAEQTGLKKRKRDISTDDVETVVKKLKTNMADEDVCVGPSEP